MEEDSLADWMERRDAAIVPFQSSLLVEGNGPRASHVRPDAPRLIERWNGYAWEFHTIAPNLAASQRFLYSKPVEEDPAVGTSPIVSGRQGTGRHRKPQTPGR